MLYYLLPLFHSKNNFIIPKGKTLSNEQLLSTLPFHWPLATPICILSLSILKSIFNITYKLNHTFSRSGLLLWVRYALELYHVVACIDSSLIGGSIFHCMDTPFIHSSTDRCVGCFYLWLHSKTLLWTCIPHFQQLWVLVTSSRIVQFHGNYNAELLDKLYITPEWFYNMIMD